jgi:sec-independent protein translocase protein TatC
MISIYLIEIRNRVLLLAILWVLLIFVTYYYKETLLFLFFKPIVLTNSEGGKFYFIFTNITEIFSVYLRLVIFISNQITIFYFLYHIFLFIYPGLYLNEYKFFKFIGFLSFFCWISILILLHSIFIPTSFNFFLSFQNANTFFEAKLNECLIFFLVLYNVCFTFSQIFVFLFVFLNYIKDSPSKIKSSRKIVYIFFVIFSTLITPPDIFSQVFLSFIFIVLYEFLILVSFYNYLKKLSR